MAVEAVVGLPAIINWDQWESRHWQLASPKFLNFTRKVYGVSWPQRTSIFPSVIQEHVFLIDNNCWNRNQSFLGSKPVLLELQYHKTQRLSQTKLAGQWVQRLSHTLCYVLCIPFTRQRNRNWIKCFLKLEVSRCSFTSHLWYRCSRRSLYANQLLQASSVTIPQM